LLEHDRRYGRTGRRTCRQKDASGYLPVHDLPPDRAEQTIKPADQAKIEQELISARDRKRRRQPRAGRRLRARSERASRPITAGAAR